MSLRRERAAAQETYTCALCGRALPTTPDPSGDHEGARVDRCSAYGASYAFWEKQRDYGIGFTEDPYDPDLAWHEAVKARGEKWSSLRSLVQAHKRWVETGRLPTPRQGEATLDRFREFSGPRA